MMISIPKIRKSNGQKVETVIEASAIKGFDSFTMVVKGVPVKGTKVFTGGSWFFSPVPPLMLAQAKVQALSTGKLQVVSPGQVIEVAVVENKELIEIPAKSGFKPLIPPGSALGWNK